MHWCIPLNYVKIRTDIQTSSIHLATCGFFIIGLKKISTNIQESHESLFKNQIRLFYICRTLGYIIKYSFCYIA